MKHFLALDIGRKHTGIAYADDRLSVPVPLETLHHETDEELVHHVAVLSVERKINEIVLGLPLLSHGVEGQQAEFVREVAESLGEHCPSCTLHFLDERWTDKTAPEERGDDDHAQAAVTLLQVFLERRRSVLLE